MIFEELFAKTDDEKILDKLGEIVDLLKIKKQPMTYVPYPVYVEVPWWKYWRSPEAELIPLDPLPYVYPDVQLEIPEWDFAEYVCLGSSVVST